MKTATEKESTSIIERRWSSGDLSPRSWLAALAAIFLLNLLLRVFYLRFDFVNGDEAIRALTATGWLDGARLYVDIVTDKPPATTFFYAAVFALCGRSMIAVHLAAALWNFCTAGVLYRLAAHHYNRRVGLWAALLFVYFSTNYLTQDMQAANTELLMALPYTAAVMLYLRAESDGRIWLLPLAGVLTGVAILFKQLGVFNLAFFAIAEFVLLYQALRHESRAALLRRACQRLLLLGAGVLVVFAALFLWLRVTGALLDFWRSVFEINTVYIVSVPLGLWLRYFIGRGLGYVLLNFALWAPAIWIGARSLAAFWRERRSSGRQSAARRSANLQADGQEDGQEDGQADGKKEQGAARPNFARADRATLDWVTVDWLIALWALASLAAVFAGGRFFGHYFIQALPALALLAARGVETLRQRLRMSAVEEKKRARIALAFLLLCFLIGLVRFHQRTAILAYETLTGARTAASEDWGMSQRQREAAHVTQQLQGRIAAGEPLYIWDYALDVYWQTGARPAARFLTPNHVTGVFTDAETRQPTAREAAFWATSRQLLREDLQRQRPRLILDVTGGLMQLSDQALIDFLRANYEREGALRDDSARPFIVYRLKESVSDGE